MMIALFSAKKASARNRYERRKSSPPVSFHTVYIKVCRYSRV